MKISQLFLGLRVRLPKSLERSPLVIFPLAGTAEQKSGWQRIPRMPFPLEAFSASARSVCAHGRGDSETRARSRRGLEEISRDKVSCTRMAAAVLSGEGREGGSHDDDDVSAASVSVAALRGRWRDFIYINRKLTGIYFTGVHSLPSPTLSASSGEQPSAAFRSSSHSREIRAKARKPEAQSWRIFFYFFSSSSSSFRLFLCEKWRPVSWLAEGCLRVLRGKTTQLRILTPREGKKNLAK